MSSLGVVLDVVVGFVSEPIWKWSVLPLLFGKPSFHQKRFIGTHMW
jgi:hypothetical protein